MQFDQVPQSTAIFLQNAGLLKFTKTTKGDQPEKFIDQLFFKP